VIAPESAESEDLWESQRQCRATRAAHDVSFGTEPYDSRGPPPMPWQFGVRAVAVITGLTLLVIVDVHGVAFYFALGLVGLALVTEATATFVYWRGVRRRERS
jgi:hypothetical protein